jgi:hypothetical protein
MPCAASVQPEPTDPRSHRHPIRPSKPRQPHARNDAAARSLTEKLARLQALAQDAPAVFQALLVHAYGAYYTHPRVVEALGLPPRPPFPKGYDVPATDFSLLDPVRRRAKLYREC